MAIRILLVEDDPHISQAVATFLQAGGYEVDTCLDGNEAYEHFLAQTYQLVILDIMLPGMDGYQLLDAMRALSTTPILMLSALSDETQQIRAFDALADDYVAKPFKMQLLIKRVEALLRRSGTLVRQLTCQGVTLLIDEATAVYEQQDLKVTKKEFAILLLLCQHQQQTLSHEQILTHVWGYEYSGYVATVHTHIKNLRAKLPNDFIETVRGLGYRIGGGV